MVGCALSVMVGRFVFGDVAKATAGRSPPAGPGMEHSGAMLRNARFLVLVVLLALTACDGYIEQVTVDETGSVEFRAEATVVCTDELQQELWGGDGCGQIDEIVRGVDVAELPFDFELDQNRVGLVADGELDRRRIDATWDGTLAELETVLVSGGSLRSLDSQRTEAVFVPAGSVADQMLASDDFVAGDANWEVAEFRVIAPEVITEHNGDIIQGRTVVWHFDDDRPEEFRVVWTSETRGFQVWWWIVAGGVLITVLVMMIKLEGPNRRARNAAPDAK